MSYHLNNDTLIQERIKNNCANRLFAGSLISVTIGKSRGARTGRKKIQQNHNPSRKETAMSLLSESYGEKHDVR